MRCINGENYLSKIKSSKYDVIKTQEKQIEIIVWCYTLLEEDENEISC